VWKATTHLLPSAFVITIVTYISSMAISTRFADQFHYQVSGNQEFLAIGFANLVGCFFSSYPLAASLSRSAVNVASGARTALSGIISTSLVVVSLLFLAPVVYCILYFYFYLLPSFPFLSSLSLPFFSSLSLSSPFSLPPPLSSLSFLFSFSFFLFFLFDILLIHPLLSLSLHCDGRSVRHHRLQTSDDLVEDSSARFRSSPYLFCFHSRYWNPPRSPDRCGILSPPHHLPQRLPTRCRIRKAPRLAYVRESKTLFAFDYDSRFGHRAFRRVALFRK